MKYPIVLLALCSAFPLASQAALITSNSVSSPVVITFDQFSGTGYNFTFGPVQVGGLVGMDVIFTSSNDAVLGQGSYGLASNGNWFYGATSNGAYVGLDTNTGYVRFMFNGFTVQSVSAFLNYVPDSGYWPMYIDALDSSGNVLESYEINSSAPISTPGGSDQGAYRGITRGTADIGGFQARNAYVVLDNLTLGGAVVSEIPEPGTLGLAAFGLLLLPLLRRRN